MDDSLEPINENLTLEDYPREKFRHEWKRDVAVAYFEGFEPNRSKARDIRAGFAVAGNRSLAFCKV